MEEEGAVVLLLRSRKALTHPQALHQAQVPTTRPAARLAANQTHQAPATHLPHLQLPRQLTLLQTILM